MSKRKVRDDSFALNGPSGAWIRSEPVQRDGSKYLAGPVFTPHGIVYAQSNGLGDSKSPYGRYDFAFAGRHYVRTEKINRTARGLAIMAAKFAAEIVSEQDANG